MVAFYSAAAILGAASLAYAAPLSAASPAPSVTFSSASTSATPFSLSDGFPSPSQEQLKGIFSLAKGSLSNGARPPKLSDEGATSLQLINYNENFEVAFFSSLVNNITGNVPGFEISDKATKDYVLSVLIAATSQEELHSLNAANALKFFNKTAIIPCKYKFPTTTLAGAFELAATFTDVVLGTLQDVIQIFAANGDPALTRGVAASIGNEGEQEGFFRLMQNNPKIPNALPFLTTSTRDFAFSALQGFIVPGSCPNQNLINLKIFGPLTVATKPEAKDSQLSFSFDMATLPKMVPIASQFQGQDFTKLSLTYINQQNVPISFPLINPKATGSVVTFQANFPQVTNQLNGLTIAAVTVGNTFANAPAVANATLWGPGLIEVN